MILDGVDLPECSQAGDRRVIVGDGHVQSQAAGMAGDRLAQHMPTPVAQRRRDPQYPRLVFLARRADDLDDVRLTAGQRARLVEGEGPQPADLFEVLAAANQARPAAPPPPARRRRPPASRSPAHTDRR